ncbi:hypothetical protein AUC69_12550 [Methyloceanibacter superfactus]|uniref:Uncharacterized protein n=2 Tax=Methyloceanibacter superfactus TaxID=1774969 RepID=A0A1E3VV81_9HYPH|nr:hypothetical protein AUC69_12550 [Methyloceanibacter superfactus]
MAFAVAMSLPGTAKVGLGGPAMAQAGFAIEEFYDELAPYGEWVAHPSYGYVWLPRTVAPDWRPYTVGQWVSTDEYGWYWDSYEPFAWAVYHYGRWGFEPTYGWYWVPGDTWAPAWVQWRYGDEYVGWAPEAPAPYGGYAYGGQVGYAPPPQAAWVFVRPGHLTAPAVRSYALPRNSISIAFSRTTNVYRPEFRNGAVYNYGMPRDRWSRVTRQRIEPRKVYRGDRRDAPYGWNKGRGRDLYVYAPGVRKGAKPRKPPKKVSSKPSKKSANARPKQTRLSVQPPDRSAYRPPIGAYQNNWRPGPQPPRDRFDSGGSKPKSAKPKSAKPKSAKPKSAKQKSGNKPEAKAKSGSGKPKSAKAKSGSKSKADKSKAAKPNAAKPNAAKSKAAKEKAAKARAARAKAAKQKAANAKAAKAKAAKAKASKTKTANAKPGNGRGGSGGQGHHGDGQGKGGGKGGGKGKGGGDRAAACKANPDLPFCRRGG